ncbi:hypothetical protein LTR28_001307 [Elasticomyces elasticus]|nr:hypothetical protein LTR28_001307 [Elasticomyces elasticus]
MHTQPASLGGSYEDDGAQAARPLHVRKLKTLPRVVVPSFSAFRAQASSIPRLSPVRAKPLPLHPSPRSTSFSAAERPPPPLLRDVSSVSRPLSLDSPLPRGLDGASPSLADDFAPRDLDRFPHGYTPLATHARVASIDSRLADPDGVAVPIGLAITGKRSSIPVRPSSGSSKRYSQEMRHSKSSAASMHRNGAVPNMTVQLDGVTSTSTNTLDSDASPDVSSTPKLKSPNGLTTFFAWNSSQLGTASPTTTFSERSASPGLPLSFAKLPQTDGNSSSSRLTPPALDIPKAHARSSEQVFDVLDTPFLVNSPAMNAHVDELERELRQVSTELARSIGREMELEDEVERCKAGIPPAASELTRRSSDYFSDSGTSSVRYPIIDPESRLEELGRLRRKAEQERAQLRVDFAQKLQDDLRRRRGLENHIHTLEERLHGKTGERELGVEDEAAGRIQELEMALADHRRRLSEERQAKNNFEDLFTALRRELEQHRNERDNLRDEIVPQLYARIEGLEAETAELQPLNYENTRMQQELQSLREENYNLSETLRIPSQAGKPPSHFRFNSIAEEGDIVGSSGQPRVGLTRSISLARSSATSGKPGLSSLSRSNSVKDRGMDSSSRPGTDPIPNNRIKGIEDQRDALHKALRLLLDRQTIQQREHEKAIRVLTAARDKAMSVSPRRSTFYREVRQLRDEVDHLRQRADDALEQKWQCEKGLGGLKMDLDRAEQETSLLRDMLQQRRHGTGPETPVSRPSTRDGDRLDSSHATESLDMLLQTIAEAEAERDYALREAESYRQKAKTLERSTMDHLDRRKSLAAQLLESAGRMDALASQVQQHLHSNTQLRERLAAAIGRGETEQKASTARIAEMQSHLKTLEDGLVAAQLLSETALSAHEEDVARIQQAHHPHLHRLHLAVPSPSRVPPRSPASPRRAARSPRLGRASPASVGGDDPVEAGRAEFLEKRVGELETALGEAEAEMHEVVRRINASQIEVAELTGQRDEAMRHTRRLQAEIEAERRRAEVLMAE